MASSDERKTKRLLLRPLTESELRQRLYKAESSEAISAYNQTLYGLRTYPAHWLWHTIWTVNLRTDGTEIGEIGFKGHPSGAGEVEVSFSLLPDYQGKGYGVEMLESMVDWAFSHPEVYFILAETAADNLSSQNLLKKLDFRPTWLTGVDGPIFERERKHTNYAGLTVAVGLCVGMILGIVWGGMESGIAVGVLSGAVLGWGLDAKDRRKRENIRKRRQ